MSSSKTAGRRAAIANRVSRVKGASIPEQDADNTAWCEAEGIEVYDRYEEEGSASRYARRSRKEWPRLIADLQAGSFELVVLWESSRGDRKLAEWVAFLDLCLDRGVLIHVTSEDRTYDMSISSDYNQMAQAGITNREESEKTSKRMNRVVRNLARKGAPSGKLPWSYRREYEFVPDPDTGRQIRIIHQLPDEVKGPLTDEMADDALAGKPLSEIARDVQARVGGTWDGRRVREILLNPTIAGLRVFQGEVVGDALWLPVLASGDRDAAKVKFARLEAKLKDPARRTHRDASVKHLLTGVARCGYGGDLAWPGTITREQFAGLCGGQFRWNMNGKVASYECRAAWHVTCAEPLADEMVEEAVILRLAQPDAREVFVRPDVSGDVAKAKAEVAALKLRLKGFYSQAAKGKISEMGIAEIEAELLPDIKKWEKKATPQVITPLVEKLITAEDVRGYWASLLVPQKREVIRAIVTPVILPVGRAATKPVPERIKFLWLGASTE